MPSNDKISAELRKLLREDIVSRPFLCKGSPASCEVVLIGINPASKTPFWDFWDENGYDKEAWLRKYLEIEGGYSPTRKRIEFIENKLPKELRDRRVFGYVLTLADPKVMCVFGASPTKELAAVLGYPLPFGSTPG